jgi:hypothetical protein
MNRRHILLLGVLVLTVGLAFAGQASARHLSSGTVVSQTSAAPDLIERYVQRQVPVAPDLIERYVQRQPASSYYTPAALKAEALRMQAMVRAYERSTATAGTTSSGFDVSDGLIGAAGGIGIAICAAGLLVAVARTRRPQVAL